MNRIFLNRGKFLLSEPRMQDFHFKRSVLLLTEHNQNESIGFILNQPTNLIISDIVKDFPKFNANLFIGGPVEKNTLHFIHSLGSKIENSMPILDGLYWSGNFETVKSLIRKGEINDSEIKFFLGYSGWNTGQLEQELQEQAWIVVNSDATLALEKNDQKMWQNIIKKMDKDYAIWHTMPDDPELN